MNQNIAFKKENYKDMKILLDEYTLPLFEAISHPTAVGAQKTVELDEDEMRDAEAFMNEIMNDDEDDDEMDDI